jgi:F0F1-type ATP synthase epsilon subunit
MKVIVRTTEDIVYNGEADRVSSFNEVGRFDIYPMHANFISILNKEITLYLHKEKVKEMKIEQAVMKVKGDVIHIFLGIEALFVDDAQPSTPPAK